jgi:sirohydrochlorin ferrochelatase
VAHGSRDPRSHQALAQFAHLFAHRVAHRYGLPEFPSVHTATLEFGLPLAIQIQHLATALVSAPEPTLNLVALKILPLFLLPGTHVRVDIPQAVATAQPQVGLPLTLSPYLGSHGGMVRFLGDRLAAYTPQPWLLLAHGSRYPGGNAAITALATQLQATPVFWSVGPTLEMGLRALVAQGHPRVGILPYFLFSGSITDAIITRVDQLRSKFTQTDIHLISPLEPSPALADLLTDFI